MKTLSVKLGKQIVAIMAVGLGFAAANLTDGALLIVDPTGVVASSTFVPRVAGHLIDNSGLSFALNTGDPVPGTYPTHDEANPSDTMYLSAENQPLPTITFDLGSGYLLTGFHYWNYNEAGFTSRSVQGVDVSVSTDGGANYGAVGSFTLLQASGLGTYTGADQLFGSDTLADHVRFVVTSNHGDASFSGLSEIRFIENFVIPEPASVALLGLGGLLVLARRLVRRSLPFSEGGSSSSSAGGWRQREKME